MSTARCWCVETSFLDHRFTQDKCSTDQQVLQVQILELGRTSFVQITHSYWPFAISSWVRVAISGACDLDIRRGRGACSCLARGATGWPGTKTGASPAKEPSAEAGVFAVSCPPNARWPFTIGCAPPLLPPRPSPPRLPRPPLFVLEFGEGAGDGSGATEAGLRARDAFAAGGAGVALPDAPPLLPPRRRWRGARFRPAWGGASTADIFWGSTIVVIDWEAVVVLRGFRIELGGGIFAW